MNKQKFILKHLFIAIALGGLVTSSCFSMEETPEEAWRTGRIPKGYVLGLNADQHQFSSVFYNLIHRNFRTPLCEIKEHMTSLNRISEVHFGEHYETYFKQALEGFLQQVRKIFDRDRPEIKELHDLCRQGAIGMTPDRVNGYIEAFTNAAIPLTPVFLRPLEAALAFGKLEDFKGLDRIFTTHLELLDNALNDIGLKGTWLEDLRPWLFPDVFPIKKGVEAPVQVQKDLPAVVLPPVQELSLAQQAPAPVPVPKDPPYDAFMKAKEGAYYRSVIDSHTTTLKRARGGESIMFYQSNEYRAVLRDMLEEGSVLDSLMNLHGIKTDNAYEIPELSEDETSAWGLKVFTDGSFRGGLASVLKHSSSTSMPFSPKTAFLKMMQILKIISEVYPKEEHVNDAVRQAFAFMLDQEGACAAGLYGRSFLLGRQISELLVNGLKDPFVK